MSSKYAVGVDFGTESGRAVLVDVADGHEVATAVYQYAQRRHRRGAPAGGNPTCVSRRTGRSRIPSDYLRTFQDTSRPCCGRPASTRPT